MLSNSSKYAIKAVLYLALYSSKNNKVMVKDIAKPINVPQAYIAKLLQELVKADIISSERGPKGGFYLNKENKRKTILNIVAVVNGKEQFNTCMLSLEKCNDHMPCPLHAALNPLRNDILNNLRSQTISELVKDVEMGKSFLPV